MLTALSITVTIAVFATFMKTFYDATCLFFCYRAKASRPCLETNSLSCRNRPKMLVSVLPGQLVLSVDGPGSPTQNQCLKNSITPRLRIPLSVLGPPDHKLARDSILFSIIAQLALQIQRVCV